MAEKSQQLVLDALQRALSAPQGLPLFATRTTPGLFAAAGPARKAAELCKEHGYLQVLRTEGFGKASCEICTISDSGLALLLAESSPRQPLEALVRAADDQREQFTQIAAALERNRDAVEALRALAERTLQNVNRNQPAVPSVNGNGQRGIDEDLLQVLHAWNEGGPLEDCPLPRLQRALADRHAKLTIGQFHDSVRRLHMEQRIYLHPWTGPLYEIPEPTLAFMVGHEIAWYVSLR